ncbi:GntR family transcriptional regulator, partial [Erythrobacteraceae bacterium E2-1 Yellow Sea]|nr:GntR family transcriptional regulator [Erythrobacteraceae bacterium E2-1 Yellow Sea]
MVTRPKKGKTSITVYRTDQAGEAEPISSSDSVVQYICSGILDGRIVPGQRLIEGDLTRILTVSRGPVRALLQTWGTAARRHPVGGLGSIGEML